MCVCVRRYLFLLFFLSPTALLNWVMSISAQGSSKGIVWTGSLRAFIMASPHLTWVMMATWNASIVLDVLKRVAGASYSCACNARVRASAWTSEGKREKKTPTSRVIHLEVKVRLGTKRYVTFCKFPFSSN